MFCEAHRHILHACSFTIQTKIPFTPHDAVLQVKYKWLIGGDENYAVKIHLNGPYSNPRSRISWDCPMFTAALDGWSTPKPTVQIKQGNQPSDIPLFMLLAYLSTISFAPTDFSAHVPISTVRWPGVHVPGYGYYP